MFNTLFLIQSEGPFTQNTFCNPLQCFSFVKEKQWKSSWGPDEISISRSVFVFFKVALKMKRFSRCLFLHSTARVLRFFNAKVSFVWMAPDTAWLQWPIFSDQTESHQRIYIKLNQAHSLYMMHDPTGATEHFTGMPTLIHMRAIRMEEIHFQKVFHVVNLPFMRFFCRSLSLLHLEWCHVATMEGTVVCGPFYRLWLLTWHVTPPSKNAFGWVVINDVIMRPWQA